MIGYRLILIINFILQLLQYIFNCKPGDVFCCLAGLGWLAGQNYVVYGPLANGGTSVLFECSPYGGIIHYN